MIIKIGKPKKPKSYSRYVVEATFMEGDADGFDYETVEFKLNEYEDLQRFILALEVCNAAWSSGKGGCDEYHGLLEYDAFFSTRMFDDKYEEVLKTINPNNIRVDHPSDSQGYSHSFYGYKVKYIDENGIKYPVTVTFNEQHEKDRIQFAKDNFK